jgi:hypothetical protein
MPDELFYDPQAMELRAEIKALQAEFVDAHKALDAAQEHVRCARRGRASFVVVVRTQG